MNRPYIAIVCSGMDRVKRGYEIYARDLFELLKNEPGFDLTLIKGNGKRKADEKVVFNLSRDSAANRAICAVIGRQWKYYIEFVTFALGMLPLLLFSRFDAFYALEGPIYKFLSKWRRLTGGKFKLIHFTGGQLGDVPATSLDYVHHVTPAYREQATKCGFRGENQFLIPHFVDEEKFTVADDVASRLRARLGISDQMKVVLSVGTIDSRVKRMDYVIREVAALSEPTFLLLLGHQDESSRLIRDLVEKLLPQRHMILTVPRSQMPQYYKLADVFVLASLREGFGLVFLEALASGVPIVAHDYDVSRYVLERHGYFIDMTRKSELTNSLKTILAKPAAESDRQTRRDYVQQKYASDRLLEAYRQMLAMACRG
jgi:1,2-diacylglycerol 3-alpha-glucosyltransferase